MKIVLVPDGRAEIKLPSTGAQSVSRRADGSFVVEIRRMEAAGGGTFPYQGNDAELLESLQPSRIYTCRDGQIVEAARSAVGDCTDSAQACRKLELFVHAFIAQKVETADERASTILQNQRGTCRQHAILMVTLCRALGIPARMVTGFAAAGPRELAGHAWVECRIGDRWVDYDPTWNGFDVSHLALWTGPGKTDYEDYAAKIGHFTAAQVKLTMPWYRHLAWLAVIPAAIPFWLLLRLRKRLAARKAAPAGSQQGNPPDESACVENPDADLFEEHDRT